MSQLSDFALFKHPANEVPGYYEFDSFCETLNDLVAAIQQLQRDGHYNYFCVYTKVDRKQLFELVTEDIRKVLTIGDYDREGD